ncbi:MAG: peptidyl-prolyl cis-trans isomerase, partial [Candidatus Eiseniibacteriota bacterium]
TGPVVAIIGTRKVTRHEVDSLIATAPSSIQPQLRQPDGYRDVVQRIVLQEGMYGAAKRAGLEKDSTYLASLNAMAKDLLIRRYYDYKTNNLPAIPDSAIQNYYDTHGSEFTIEARARVRHIQFPTKAKAAQVRTALTKGALWDATCKKYSTDKATQGTGGNLGWVTQTSDNVPGVGKAPSIVAAAFALPIDAISQPVKSDKNWHLIKVETREEKKVQPLESVRPRIETRLKNQQREEYGKAFGDSIMQSAVIFDDSIRVALSPGKTPEDYFKEAQAAVTPLERIGLYRGLIARYPHERVSIQAQFMIGFTYAEELGEYGLATQEFQQFLKDHPDSDLATSAQWMIDNMERPAPDLNEEDNGASPDSTEAAPEGTKGSP